jgi:hypothetical protein
MIQFASLFRGFWIFFAWIILFMSLMAMLVNLFRIEQFIECLKFSFLIIIVNFSPLGLLRSTLNKLSWIFFLFTSYLCLPVDPAALSIANFIFLYSVSMVQIVLLVQNISWLRSCVSLMLVVLFLVSKSFLWNRTLNCHVMRTDARELFALSCILTIMEECN